MTNDLEKARAEVARLEKLEAPVTLKYGEYQKLAHTVERAERLLKHLGAYRDPHAGNGDGYRLKVMDKIEERLTESEERIRIVMEKIAGDGSCALDKAKGSVEARLTALEGGAK